MQNKSFSVFLSLAIFFLAFISLFYNFSDLIPPVWAGGAGVTVDFQISNPLGPTVTGVPQILDGIARFVFNLMLVISPIVIIYSGILFLTSRGDPAKVTKAKKALTYALLGLAVALIGKGFISLIKSILCLGGSCP